MTTFTVRCRIDAYVNYCADVEAGTPAEAAQLAEMNHSAYKWEHEGSVEFDARYYTTLNENGGEIEGTRCGDIC